MPVTISVSQIRDALYQGERNLQPSTGETTSALLGQWFHEGLTQLVTNSTQESPLRHLADVDNDLTTWERTLIQQSYEQFVGPKLSQHRAGLQQSSREVLNFWIAIQEACKWISGICWSLKPNRRTRHLTVTPPWSFLSSVINTNEPLVCELREADWSDSVRLTGIADAVVRLNSTGAWCLLEFKTGETSPVADLGQACLYHMILSKNADLESQEMSEVGDLALISFRPERQEQIYSGQKLYDVRKKLLDLIGALAGVKAGSSKPETIAKQLRTKPTPEKKSPDSSEPSAVPSSPRTGAIEADEFVPMGKKIIEAFAEFGVKVTLGHPIDVGPTFVRFPLIPGRGTKVASIEKLAKDIQIRLGFLYEPFIERHQGQLVIDVERPERQIIPFDEIVAKIPQTDVHTGSALVPVGIDLSGELICADMSQPDHCHILVAGTTGSGKSEWLRTAIAGLIIRNTPETLRLLIIDPKRNAFHALRDSPFLLKPLVFPDEQSVVTVLEELCEEMDRRYRLLNGADSIADYNSRSDKPVPRIVCVCDEYRDLISMDRKERKLIEGQICRLGAKARAAGIHLILATQEPSRDTIKGPLDSNMPAKVGLKMQKHIESNMLLGMQGAEKLLGHGDLLFKDNHPPRRLQAPLMSEENRTEIFGA